MVPQVICMKLWPIRLNWVKFINLASSEEARSTCTHMISPWSHYSLIRQKLFCCPLDGITCHIDRMVEVLIEYFKHFLLLSCQADCCSVALVDTDTERGSRGLHPCFAQNQGLLPPFSLKGGSQIHVQAYNNRLKNTQKSQIFGKIWLRNISLR